ncbi:MAG TPA: hypothetical protein VK731_06470 [Candidatus Cybelea sp.]|nr:hypothetical protein [Candidatus Cybelea sp.]
MNKWFALAAGGFTAFVFFWKHSRSPSALDKPPEPAEKQEADNPTPESPAPADSPAAIIQKEATRAVQIIFMASLLQTLQERINTITFESEYTFKNSLENGVDVKSKAITDHIGEYLVENMDAADWQIVSATTGFVPRNIPNDGFAGFEYRAMKAKQIDRLNFMATQFKKLIDNYRKRPI